jgi:hypothetical protein
VHEQELPWVKSFSKGRIWDLRKERGGCGLRALDFVMFLRDLLVME